MKIAVIGYAGAGKSTLAQTLSLRYNIPVLHFDTVQFTPNWKIRDRQEAHRIVHEFLENPEWVMDGTYSKFEYERRMAEADEIVILALPRMTCFFRAVKRYFSFRGKSRPDMADGCCEKLDPEFIGWLLWKGRTKKRRQTFQQLVEQYPEKTAVLKSQQDIDRYLEDHLS